MNLNEPAYESNIFRMVWVWCQRCTQWVCNLYVVICINDTDYIVKFQCCWLSLYSEFHECLRVAKT